MMHEAWKGDQRWTYKMILMEYELALLKQLKGAGERGRDRNRCRVVAHSVMYLTN